MLTEKTHTGGFLISEAEGKRSRENVTLISGQNLYPGQVLGKISASGKYTAHDDAASDGSETAFAVLYDRADASSADLEVAIIARDAEVNGNELLWGSESPTEVTEGITELASVGIIVR